MDEKLKWTPHIHHVENKISKGLGMMGRVRNIMPNNVLLTLYYSLIYPYLTYCCIIWGAASSNSLHHLNVLQNRAMRLITRSPFRASATPIFKKFKLLKIVDIRKMQILLFMYKCKNKLLPNCCLQYCPISLNHPYSMRCIHYFLQSPYRTNIREQSVSILGPRIWDSISVDLQNSASLLSFKFGVSNYLVSLYI